MIMSDLSKAAWRDFRKTRESYEKNLLENLSKAAWSVS